MGPRRSMASTPEPLSVTPSAPLVLVVEDHAVVRVSLGMALSQLGMSVVAALDLAVDAVMDVARSVWPDVVLLDFFLGDDDALPLIAPLRDLGAVVLVMTAAEDPAILGRCIERGAAAICAKSGELDEMVDVIARAAAGERVLDADERERLLQAAHDHGDEEAKARAIAAIEALTPREQIVLGRLVDGKSASEIADSEYVSLTTVRAHIRNILRKLDVKSQLGAVAVAHRAGWPRH